MKERLLQSFAILLAGLFSAERSRQGRATEALPADALDVLPRAPVGAPKN